MSDKLEILALIGKCFAGSATPEEMIHLEEWIAISEENRKYVVQMKNLWDVSNPALSHKDIRVDQALVEVITKTLPRPKTRRFFSYLQKAAAILILPLLAGSFLWGRYMFSDTQQIKNKPIYNEVYAAFGTRSSLTLSDGSKVWLNSGSKLRYPDRFTRKARVVYLSGEGYFEVESDASKPFVVNTRKLSVKATGTKFNVNALHFNGKTEVTLLSGEVKVSKKMPGHKLIELSEMKPNQHLAFDTLSGAVELSHGDTYKYIAWKDGKLIFRNEPFSDVIKKIGYFYNVDIELHGSDLKDFSYRATFEEETVDEILKLLKISSPIQYYEKKREPGEDGTFPKRKIIIYAKQ